MAATRHPLTTARRHRLGGLIIAALVFVGVGSATVFSFADDAHGSNRMRGDEVRGSEFTYAVHRVEATDVLADPAYPDLNVTADGRFVIVKISVTNVTDSPHTFQSRFATVSDGVREYGIDDTAWQYVGQPTKEVPAGTSIDAAVVFDVPKGFDARSIVLRDGADSHRVAVAFN